jgi:hypothetical protein
MLQRSNTPSSVLLNKHMCNDYGDTTTLAKSADNGSPLRCTGEDKDGI